MGLGQGCSSVGRSQKGSDSECILKVDLAGFFHGIGVEEKETIKHNLGFSKLNGIEPRSFAQAFLCNR